MNSLIGFVARLVGDVWRFLDVFVNDLILGVGDPLSALLIVVGQSILAVALAVFGYAAVGALLGEVGVDLPSLGGRGRTD